MRKILVVLVAALWLPMPVSAECAWILWRHTTINSLTPPYEQVWWTIETSAVESSQVCSTMKEAVVRNAEESDQRARLRPGTNVESVDVAGDELVITRLKSGGGITQEFLCLPDTLDPRPR